jgi:hypothetical protein
MLELHVRSIYLVNMSSLTLEPVDSNVRMILESKRGHYHCLWEESVPGLHEEAIQEAHQWLRESFEQRRRQFRYPKAREAILIE